jgi:flagellar hook-basal body complex protein FliE
MTVNPIGAIDPSQVTNLVHQFANIPASDPSATATSGIGSDLNTTIGGDLSTGTLDPATASGRAAAVRGSDFASMIGSGLQNVENLDQVASTKAIAAATGDLNDVHDYVIAATEAQTATELTTTLRNKAMDSFNQIMGMSL